MKSKIINFLIQKCLLALNRLTSSSNMFSPTLQPAIDKSTIDPEEAFKMAIIEYEKALLISDELLIHESKSVMAYSSQFIGLYSEAYSYAKEALQYFEESNNLFAIAFNLNTLGFIYNYFQDHEERLKVNLKSLEIRKKINDPIGICKSLNNTGDTYIKLGKYDDALVYLEEGEKLLLKMNKTFKAVLYMNMAECYFFKENSGVSKKYLKYALEESKKINLIPILYQCYKIQSQIAWKEKDTLSCEKYLKKAEQLVLDNKEFFNEEIEISRLISKFYSAHNRFEEAFLYEKRVNERNQIEVSKKHKKELNSILIAHDLKELESKKTELQQKVDQKTQELTETLSKLEVQNAFNKKILNSAFHSIIIFDTRGQIQKFNVPAKKLLNLEQKKHLSEFIVFQNDYDLNKLLKQLFATKSSNLIKFNFEMKSKVEVRPLFLNVNFTSVEDAGERVGIAFVEDITFKIEAEKKRKEDLEAEIAINDFAQFLFTANSVDEILWGVAKKCISRLGFVDCVIYQVHPERNSLIQKAAYGNKSSDLKKIINPIEIPIGQGIVGSVALKGQIERIDDTSQDERYLIDDDIRYSELAIPIKIGRKVFGVIDSEHPEKSFYTDKHIRVLTTISQLVGNRIEKLVEQEEKEKLREKIIHINSTLEQQVIEKTEENLRLNRSIAEKEKQLFLGEMAALTSHEMNTPLANIQNATSAIVELNFKVSASGKKLIDTLVLNRVDLQEYGLLKNRKAVETLTNKILAYYRDTKENPSKTGLAFLVKMNVVDHQMLEKIQITNYADKEIKEVSIFLQNETFKKIITENVNILTQVVSELKSVKWLNETEKSNDFKIHSAVEKALLQCQAIHKFKENEIDQNISIKAQESKIIQMFIDIFKLAEENAIFNTSSKVVIRNEKENERINITILFNNIEFDPDFFKLTEKGASFTNYSSTTKIKLRIINSILEDHNAMLERRTGENFILLTFKF